MHSLLIYSLHRHIPISCQEIPALLNQYFSLCFSHFEDDECHYYFSCLFLLLFFFISLQTGFIATSPSIDDDDDSYFPSGSLPSPVVTLMVLVVSYPSFSTRVNLITAVLPRRRRRRRRPETPDLTTIHRIFSWNIFHRGT